MGKLFNSSFRMLVLFLAISSSIFIAGCGDDDDDPVAPGGNNNQTNTVTIDGGIFDNQTINLTGVGGGYSVEDNISAVIMQGLVGQDTLAVTIAFPGSSTGTFEWQNAGSDEAASGTLILVGQSDVLVSDGSAGATVVTAYGAVGQTISGTFSGSVVSGLNTESYNISGSFSVTRFPDQ